MKPPKMPKKSTKDPGNEPSATPAAKAPRIRFRLKTPEDALRLYRRFIRMTLEGGDGGRAYKAACMLPGWVEMYKAVVLESRVSTLEQVHGMKVEKK